MSNYILIVQIDVPEEHDAEFNKLYDSEHFHLLRPKKKRGGVT